MTEEKKEELKVLEEAVKEFEGGKKPWFTLNMKDKFTLKESVAALANAKVGKVSLPLCLIIRGDKTILEVFINNVGYAMDNTTVIFMIDEEKKHYFNASPGQRKDSLFLNSFTPPQLGALLDDLKTGKELMIRLEDSRQTKDSTISLFKSKRSIDEVLDFPDSPYSFKEIERDTSGEIGNIGVVAMIIVIVVGMIVLALN